MKRFAYAAAVVVALAVGVTAFSALSPRLGTGSDPTPTATIQQTPNGSPSPSTSPRPSPSPGFSRFDSTIHGISLDYPSEWQTRPATEPWTGGPLTFDSPAADVIFDPTLGDRVYLILASQPYGGLTEDAWRDGILASSCTGGGSFGSWRVDGADAFATGCGSHNGVLVFTEARGYLIWLVVASDEPGLADTYDWNWLKPMLETVDLRPEDALPSPG